MAYPTSIPRRVRTRPAIGLWSTMAIRQSMRGASLSFADSSVMPRANGLASLVEGVILSWGWRRRAIAFVSGAIGALALPPFSAFALIAAPLTIAVWLIDGAHDRGEAGRSSVRYEPPSARGGGWASAIFSPGSGGLARPFWSRPIDSLGRCRSEWWRCRRPLPSFRRRDLRSRGSCGRRDRRGFSRSRSGSVSPNGRAASSSPAFPGTTSAWRSAPILSWRRSPRSSACTGSLSSRSRFSPRRRRFGEWARAASIWRRRPSPPWRSR